MEHLNLTDEQKAAYTKRQVEVQQFYQNQVNKLRSSSWRKPTRNQFYRGLLDGLMPPARTLSNQEAARIQPQIGRGPGSDPMVPVVYDAAYFEAKTAEMIRMNDLAREVMKQQAEPPRPKGKPCPPGLARALALHRPVSTDHLEMRERDERATTWPR